MGRKGYPYFGRCGSWSLLSVHSSSLDVSVSWDVVFGRGCRGCRSNVGRRGAIWWSFAGK